MPSIIVLVAAYLLIGIGFNLVLSEDLDVFSIVVMLVWPLLLVVAFGIFVILFLRELYMKLHRGRNE